MKEVAIKRPLPSIDELYADPIQAAKQNDLNRLLNRDPRPEWIKEHPFAKGVRYIPISILEYLLTAIFLQWRIEVLDSKVIANAVQVTVRLSVQDPLTGEWMWQDGIGAAPIQTAKGASATDFTQINTDAVVKASPAAKSYAFKDACESFGRLFGKDLGRKDFLTYIALDGKLDKSMMQATPDYLAELYSLLSEASLSHDEDDNFREQIANGISIEDYEAMKSILIDRRISPIQKLRNGETLSMGEINKIVKQKISE